MNIELKVLKDAPPSLPASGPFVVELGDQTAVGIAAHEVAAILESERHAHARVFRIHRAYPDGRMELVGVARERFNLEDAFLFWRANERDARQDFDRLRRAAAATPPPCRTRVHLAHVPSAATPDGPASMPYLLAMLYPAEFSEDMSAWLLALPFNGGDRVEGGVGAATEYQSMSVTLLERLQLWGTQDGTLASAGEAPSRANARAS